MPLEILASTWWWTTWTLDSNWLAPSGVFSLCLAWKSLMVMRMWVLEAAAPSASLCWDEAKRKLGEVDQCWCSPVQVLEVLKSWTAFFMCRSRFSAGIGGGRRNLKDIKLFLVGAKDCKALRSRDLPVASTPCTSCLPVSRRTWNGTALARCLSARFPGLKLWPTSSPECALVECCSNVFRLNRILPSKLIFR